MARELDKLPQEQRDIISKHQAATPIAVGKLAIDLGLIVKSATLAPGISGEIKRFSGANSGYMIRINRHESKVRQRFTLAHEISHYLLHKEDIGDGITDDVLYRSTLSDAREAEANRLAADILMPWSVIEKKLKAYKDMDVENRVKSIANELEVSTIAMEIRLNMSK